MSRAKSRVSIALSNLSAGATIVELALIIGLLAVVFIAAGAYLFDAGTLFYNKNQNTFTTNQAKPFVTVP